MGNLVLEHGLVPAPFLKYVIAMRTFAQGTRIITLPIYSQLLLSLSLRAAQNGHRVSSKKRIIFVEAYFHLDCYIRSKHTMSRSFLNTLRYRR